MNSFIETLNQSGGQFLTFAWPMFWQSSLLIGCFVAFDLLFRRKIRASIRYALWLVVLVKLCLPPALALPTGAAWWLFPVQRGRSDPAGHKIRRHLRARPRRQRSLPQIIRPRGLCRPTWMRAGGILLGCAGHQCRFAVVAAVSLVADLAEGPWCNRVSGVGRLAR